MRVICGLGWTVYLNSNFRATQTVCSTCARPADSSGTSPGHESQVSIASPVAACARDGYGAPAACARELTSVLPLVCAQVDSDAILTIGSQTRVGRATVPANQHLWVVRDTGVHARHASRRPRARNPHTHSPTHHHLQTVCERALALSHTRAPRRCLEFRSASATRSPQARPRPFPAPRPSFAHATCMLSCGTALTTASPACTSRLCKTMRGRSRPPRPHAAASCTFCARMPHPPREWPAPEPNLPLLLYLT